MREACVVLDRNGQPFHWHLPGDRKACEIPDSRSLWSVLWENRERLGGVAHSHPWPGVPAPSQTDVTTFAAIEAALGKRLNWWIVSTDKYVLVHYVQTKIKDPYSYVSSEIPWVTQPEWIEELRRASM
jgi:hypothetical protein